MTKTKTREQVQMEALTMFQTQQKQKGTICLSTGTGKSKIAIDFIRKNEKINTVLITSPRTNLKSNWEKELIKWGFQPWTDSVWQVITGDKDRLIHITIENVQTTYKWSKSDRSFDFIVADEIHTMMTPEYSNVFNIKYNYLMGLTATHDILKDNDKEYFYTKHCPIIYEYYESADDGLINKTRFFIVNHILNNDFKTAIKSKTSTFYKGEADHYEYLTNRMESGQKMMMQQGSQDWFTDAGNWFWNGMGNKEQKFAAMMYLNSIKYRKEFLQSLESTAMIAKVLNSKILKTNNVNKVLIFSELTKQIEKITSYTVHSHNSEELNQKRMDDFNENRIRTLGSCQSLTLGLNLKGATHGIMESYVGSKTRSQQKKGRLDRLATDDVAELWFIVVRNTQSEKWFESMSKGFDLTDAVYIDSKLILQDNFKL